MVVQAGHLWSLVAGVEMTDQLDRRDRIRLIQIDQQHWRIGKVNIRLKQTQSSLDLDLDLDYNVITMKEMIMIHSNRDRNASTHCVNCSTTQVKLSNTNNTPLVNIS